MVLGWVTAYLLPRLTRAPPCSQTWSGDNTTGWRSLRYNLRTGLNMGLSGMFNIGHDVGGFAGPSPDAELLVRWLQAGALHPRFVMNSWKADGTVRAPGSVIPCPTVFGHKAMRRTAFLS